MKKGARVSYQGRTGTVEGFMPNGMVDVRFDDASHRVERRNEDLLSPAGSARANPNPYGRRPRRSRRGRRARWNPSEEEKEELLRWRDQQLAKAERDLREARLLYPGQAGPVRPGLQFPYAGPVRGLERFIQVLKESSLESLAGKREVWEKGDWRFKDAKKEEDLVYDVRTGEWLPRDWMRIQDPKIRARKREEAQKEFKQHHLAYLLRERKEGGSLAPLSSDEKAELAFFMQKIPAPGETAPVADRDRARVWRQVLKERISEADRAAQKEYPEWRAEGETEEESYRKGEGVDRGLLGELREAWRKRPKTGADKLIKAFNEGLIGKEELYNGLVGLVPQELIFPEAEDKYKAAVAPKEKKKKKKKKKALSAAQREEERRKKRSARETKLRELSAAAATARRVITKSQSGLDAAVTERIKSHLAGFFTRPDPPRLSGDRRVYCGNPIDGTAYYLVVDNQKRQTAPFLKWETVEALARRAGAELQDKVVGPFLLDKDQSLSGLVREQVLPLVENYARKPSQRLIDWQSETTLKFKAAAALEQKPNRTEKDRREARALRIEADALGKKVEKAQKSIGAAIDLFTRKAVVEVQFASRKSTRGRTYYTDAFKKVTDLTQTIPRGSFVIITLPSKEKLDEMNEALRWYKDALEHRPGMSVFPVTERFRSYMKSRKSKYRSMRYLSPEEVGKLPKGGAAGVEANIAKDFAQIGPTGELTFFRVSKWKSSGPERLKKFRPYGYRAFNAKQAGTVIQALIDEGISEQVAEWLVASGAVRVGTNPEHRVTIDPKEEVLGPSVADDGRLTRGTKVSVLLKDKSESPFFSWVPTTVPFQVSKELMGERKKRGEPVEAYTVCLSADQKKAQSQMKVLKQRIQQLSAAYGSARSLFVKLARDPNSLKPEREDPNPRKVRDWSRGGVVEVERSYYYSDVRRVIVKLAKGYASLMRWYVQYLNDKHNHEPSARIISDVLSDGKDETGFQLGILDEYWSKFVSGQGLGQGLLTPNRTDTDLDDATAYEEFIEAYGDKLREAPPTRQVPKARSIVDLGILSQEQFEKLRKEQGGSLSLHDLATLFPKMPVPHSKFDFGPFSVEHLSGSALRWLAGDTSGDHHPTDDLLAFVWNSLDDSVKKTLLKARSAAIHGGGVRDLLKTQRSPASLKKDKDGKRPAVQLADKILWATLQYAKGGIRMGPRGNPVYGDPLYPTSDKDRYQGAPPYEEFNLIAPSGWSSQAFEQQVDSNWAISLALDDVYPAIWRGDMRPTSRDEAAELLILAVLYHQLGGYRLGGPLDPEDPCYRLPTLKGDEDACPGMHELQKFSKFLSREEAKLLGGSVNLSRTGNYTSYMTYNPVLFELTRLFWPGSSKGAGRFTSLLAQAKMLQDVDLLGRYGSAATDLQKAAVSSSSTNQVYHKLQAMLAPAGGNPESLNLIADITRGPIRPRGHTGPLREGPEEIEMMEGGELVPAVVGQDPLGQPIGHFTPYALLWPLGETMEEAGDRAVEFVSDPIPFLDELKRSGVDPALAQMIRFREVGLSRPTSELAKRGGVGKKGALADVRKGRKTYDPLDRETKQTSGPRTVLRTALAERLPPRDRGPLFASETEADLRSRFPHLPPESLDQIIKKRRQDEAKALEKFQKSPGKVLRRESSGRWSEQSLVGSDEPAEWWKEHSLPRFDRGEKIHDSKGSGWKQPIVERHFVLKTDEAKEEALKALKAGLMLATTEGIIGPLWEGEKALNPDYNPLWGGEGSYIDALKARIDRVEKAIPDPDGRGWWGEIIEGKKRKGKKQEPDRWDLLDVPVPQLHVEKEFLPPGVYDAATFRLLQEVESSPQRPPEGLPPVFDERWHGKRETDKDPKQQARWHGPETIHEHSALSRAEAERGSLAEIMEDIDDAIKTVNRKIKAESASKKRAKTKKNQRRPRRPRNR